MPLYEDLLRRAIERADAGEVVLLRCAWCDSLNLEDEWLQLDALGVAGPEIAASILDRASHGICPECLDRERRRSATLRPSA